MPERYDEKGRAIFTASEMPRVWVCPSSWAESKDKPDVSDHATSLGRSYHDLMEYAARKGREKADMAVLAISAHHGVDEAELRDLFDRFTFDPSDGEPEVNFERGYGDLFFKGRIDWMRQVKPKHYEYTDYKTTRLVAQELEAYADPQVKMYGVLMMDELDAESVMGTKAYIRRGDNGWTAAFRLDENNVEAERAFLFAIAERAVDMAKRPQEKRSYTMSRFCDYCPGRAECPAVRKEFAAAVSATKDVAILKKDGTPGKRTRTELDIDVTTENVMHYKEVAKLLGKAQRALDSRIRAFVDAVGPVEDERDPGHYLAVRRISRRPTFSKENIAKAAQILTQREDPEDTNAALNLVFSFVNSEKARISEAMGEESFTALMDALTDVHVKTYYDLLYEVVNYLEHDAKREEFERLDFFTEEQLAEDAR